MTAEQQSDAFLRGLILGALLVIVVLAVGVAIKVHDDTVVIALQGHLSKWLTEKGRFVSNNRKLLDQFCAKVVEAGVPLSRSWLRAARYPRVHKPDTS